jgi:hypothetical protein
MEDSPESVVLQTGRGKGLATNVPERLLIAQVRQRPCLFDKNVKDYRKVNKTMKYESLQLKLVINCSLGYLM